MICLAGPAELAHNCGRQPASRTGGLEATTPLRPPMVTSGGTPLPAISYYRPCLASRARVVGLGGLTVSPWGTNTLVELRHAHMSDAVLSCCATVIRNCGSMKKKSTQRGPKRPSLLARLPGWHQTLIDTEAHIPWRLAQMKKDWRSEWCVRLFFSN